VNSLNREEGNSLKWEGECRGKAMKAGKRGYCKLFLQKPIALRSFYINPILTDHIIGKTFYRRLIRIK
jgi:hypothetical protein